MATTTPTLSATIAIRRRRRAACRSASAWRRLASRNSRSTGSRSGAARSRHSSVWAETDAAEQLGVGTTHRSHVSAASDSVAQDALPVGVVVEPVPQPWPGPGERLVGQLDDSLVAGDEAGPDEQLDDLLVIRIRR